MLVVSLHGKSIPVQETATSKPVWLGGRPNLLSREPIAYPLIDSLHLATKQSSGGSHGTFTDRAAPGGTGEIKLPSPTLSTRSFGEVARMRRSALNFVGGKPSVSLEQLSTILGATAKPLSADFAATRSSFSCICMLTRASMGYNPVSTGSGRNVSHWSRCRLATSA